MPVPLSFRNQNVLDLFVSVIVLGNQGILVQKKAMQVVENRMYGKGVCNYIKIAQTKGRCQDAPWR
jgi:hypothetical protein